MVHVILFKNPHKIMKTETVIAQITLSTRIKQRDSINNVCSGLKPVTEGIRMKTKTG